MTTAELLRNLRSRDVALWVEAGRLRYSAPAGALTDDLRAELTARKGEILRLLAGADGSVSGPPPHIKATARDGDLPLSFAQQRLWFIEQLEPDSSLYNLPLALRLHGPLDADALEASLRMILARHEALRTRFKVDRGHPTQVIAPVAVLPFERIDLSSLPEAVRDIEMRRRLTTEAWRPFDLTAAPLIRVVLMRLDVQEHVLVAVMHHVVSDDWSVGVLLRELAALYEARLQGAPSPLTDLPIQYADYAVWQREHLQGEVYERELAYWRGQLAGELPVLDLPFAHAYPVQTTSRGAVHRFELSPTLTEELRQLGRREGATLFMTLLAGFQTLLHRYTQQDDILVTSPVAGRDQLETENLIGFFVNLLVLRTDFSGQPTFQEVLARVRQVALAAYAHQALPFERLVAELQPERSLHHNPLTQVVFLLQHAPAQDWRLRDLRAELVPVVPEYAKFPLTLELTERREGLSGSIEYRTDLFAAATVQRMAGHLVTLLEQAVAKPCGRISDLPLLTAAEHHQLVDNAPPATEPIRPVRREERLRPSFAQERLWFLDQLEPGNPVYNIPITLRLRGRLDVIALNDALREILRRHEVLRTNFQLADGEPFLRISPERELPLPVTDVSGLPEPQRESAIARLVTEEACHPFALAEGPLIRLSLLRLGSEDHRLLLVVHHIVFDGWSVDVFFGELAQLYNAFSQGQHRSLPELCVQYADYAAWQRGWLQGPVLESELTYWRRQLSSAPPVLELPTDRPRPVRQTYVGGQRNFALSLALATSLKELGQRQGATLFMTVLAAFQTLLHRYTHQTELVVGSPIAGRDRREAEPLIGFFVNTLALRCRFPRTVTFRELLRQVQGVTLAAYTHQWLPFEKLVEELNPERNPAQHPLFQVMLVLQNQPGQKVELAGLTSEQLPVDSGLSQFDLTLHLAEEPGGLSAAWVYSRDLFDASTIDRMAQHFETLLGGVVRDPDRRVCELPLMSDAERRQLVMDWNGTGRPYPRHQCIHQLFEDQVRMNPQATALVCGGEEATYDELNRRANRLAHHLRGLGVGPEVLVGVCLERSLEMVIGLLGILKAGGAYVPLDPTYPRERLAFMLADTRTPVLLTQRSLLDALPAGDARRVCLDADWDRLDGHRTENPINTTVPENLAYVIYTSGSTGQPKGVSVNHRGVVRLVKQTNYARFAPDEVFLQLAPVSFDASTFEIWGALLNGARLVIFPPGTPSLEEIGDALARHQITTLWLTSALFQQMVERNVAGLRSVRQLLAGGDVLSVPHVQTVLRELPQCQLINGYGPTESTTFTCCGLLHAGEALRGSVPIGRPIANTQVFLLDGALEPVPIGVHGELYIGGDGLARGYLQRPELTAEGFIPHPFGQAPGERVYKTGDVARFLADGQIEFLGRKDHQVKIRGFRIELGEIETVLRHHPAVRENVVVAREEGPGDKRLVAYVVPRPECTPTIDEVRDYLKARLPDYMVPTAFVVMPGLPMSPNGKVDRHSLPAPDQSRSGLGESFVAPRTPCEEALAEIWMEVLGTRRVCLHDNFFDVGGHSLLAMRLIARLRDQFKVSLPLRDFFESPTIAGLAAGIEKETHEGQHYSRSGTGAWQFLVPIQSVGSKRPFYLFPGGMGSEQEFLVYAKLARHLGLDQPFYGLKARSGGDREPPHRCVEDMALDYVKGIREFQPHGPYLLVGECAGGNVAFEAARQLVLQGEQIGLLALLDTDCPRRNEHLLLQLELLQRMFAGFWPVRLMGRCWFHLRQLRHLQVDEWSSYLRDKGRLGKQQVAEVFKPAAPVSPPAPPHPAEFHYFKTLIRYRPKGYPGRVTLLLSEDVYRSGRAFGWRLWAHGGLEIRTLPGNHLTYIRENVAFAAAQLLTCLRQAQTQMPASENRSSNSI